MKKLLIISIIFWVSSCQQQKNDPVKVEQYPETRKGDVTDMYFGQEVADPYRWLEDDMSEETAQWVKAQNEVTFGYLDHIEFRDAIYDRLKELYDYERVSAPFEEGQFEYFYKNDGLQDHYVLYRRPLDQPDADAEVFLDPNTFSEDGTIGLSGVFFNKAGNLSAHMITEGGSDWRKIIVMDAVNKTILEDTLVDVKFSGVAWRNNEGFYYSSYDKPEEGSDLSGVTEHHKLYFHKLGTSQDSDQLIFGGEETPRRYIGGSVTEDQRFLVISAAVSTSGNELYIKDLENNGPIMAAVENFDNDHYVVCNDGETLFIHTSLDAPNNRIITVNARQPGVENWETLIPETEEPMTAGSAGGRIFASYLVDAKTSIKQFDYEGDLEREVGLPDIGTARGFSGEEDDTYLYYTFTSFNTPSTIYKYDISSGESILYEMPDLAFDPDQFITKQVFFESKDGTRVPMFIVHRKGLELNGKNPTWLYGYGGFDISLTPSFSASRIFWLENGGVFVQVNLRGGGEYGEEWHIAGTKMNKQNVFDDFIAAAEYLIDQQYTSSDYLAIAGGSNGGLLVGATMTQRPDLMKVALPAVGVLDMLRYHKFTAGAGWAYDYGTSEDSKEMFDYLLGYSPYHNIRENIEYPATLVTTADHDDRVVPAHSFKFAARLQEVQTGDNPALIRIETRSGHGSVSLSKALEEVADEYAFTFYNMGIVPPQLKDDY